jgi:7,8-dihydropterin-6-yl-methyl-4-(beta-D-ribofuranosyl)aminobenzene 5'-phosphate synthase
MPTGEKMRIRLKTIAENSANWLGILAEWGLSILVETDGVSVLVDTGRSSVAAHNALIMGIGEEIKRIDKILFSHGHEDHTGGLIDLLKFRNMEGNPVEVIAHPEVWGPKYWRSSDGEQYSYIGIPYDRRLAESLGASFRLTNEPVWITDRIVTSGEIPMITDFEEIDKNACLQDNDGTYIADPLKDDQSLFIRSDKGIIIVSGCAHRGIVNTVKHAQKVTGCEVVYAIIGGIHLFSASDERVKLTLQEIRRLDVKRVGVSHCTGMWPSAQLATELHDRFFFNLAGNCIDMDV